MLVRRAAKNTIPVVVLAGFLGSGKTTVLNHILRTAVGARIAVIVNDFGSINIDAMLLSGQTDRTLELTNGCICCSMDGGELEEALVAAIDANPDVVIIEASGLAEPEDLARQVILSPNPKVGYGGLVYLVDAVQLNETLQKHRRISKHLELADLIVITKAEHVTASAISALTTQITKATQAPIAAVKNGELAPQLVFDMPEREVVQPSLLQQFNEECRRHLHDEYQSVTFQTDNPIDPEKLKLFMNEQPRGVYRIKGIVYFGVAGYEQKYILQSVGGRWDMYSEPWDEGEVPRTALVVIGSCMDENEVQKRLHATIGESTRLLDIERYIGG